MAKGLISVIGAMPKAERGALAAEIARDKEFFEDEIDAQIIASRRKEPSRPFRDYLKERRAR